MSDTTATQLDAQIAPPKREWLQVSKSDLRVVIYLLSSLIVVRFLNILTLPFTDTTEARYAEIARKMVETQDWITPQFQYGVPFWGKPPLHTWLSAAGMELFGVNAFGARFFIFACSAVLLWLLFRWVRDEIGAAAALVSVTILSSSVLFFAASAFVMTDMVMTLGVTLVMINLWKVLEDEPSARLNGLLVFVGLAIGLMAKGPVAVVICGIPAVLWGLTSGRWREFSKLPWLSGVLLMCALTLPWYILAELKTPGFLRYFIIGEHFERFTVPEWQGDLYGSGHERPKGTIWVGWILSFLPWSLAFAFLLFKQRSVRAGFAKDKQHWRSYLLFWALSPMILFTMSANILIAYTLPGLPASTLLLIVLLADVFGHHANRTSRLVFVTFTGFTVIVGLACIAIAQFAPASVNLRSERELVRELKIIDPLAVPYYLDSRSYSSEFYTEGRAKTLSGGENIQSLPEFPHAIIVNQDEEIINLPYLVENYRRVGDFGRKVLYVYADAGEFEQ